LLNATFPKFSGLLTPMFEIKAINIIINNISPLKFFLEIRGKL